MHTTAKRFLAMCGMVVMLVLVASITAVPAFAASNGIYTAAAHPQYRNPQTGVIEDSGGDSSEVLGQSMTESVTYQRALVEVDENGQTYVTLRLQLMDNITSAQFQVDGSPVSATCMQENYGTNSADYRIPVNSEYSLIRCNLHITAMGRDVIFFVTLSDLTSGSEDFITSITVKDPEPAPQPEPQPQPTTPSEKPDAPASETTTNGDAAKPSDAEKSGNTEKPNSSQKPSDTKKPAKDDTKKPGLQEFDEKGNAVDKAEKGHRTNGGMHTFMIVAIVVVVMAAAGFGVWYFGFFKKKK